MYDFLENNEDITELAQRWIAALKANRHVKNTNGGTVSLDTHAQVRKFQDQEPYLIEYGK